MDSVYFSTYVISARFRGGKEDQFLSQFNGKDDIFPHLISLMEDLFATPRVNVNDEIKGTKIRFTLDRPAEIFPDERVVFGYFETGFVGENINIKDFVDRTDAFNGDADRHGNAKKLFFFIKIPNWSRQGFLILQKKPQYGVKTAFTNELKSWIRHEGFMNTLMFVKPTLNGQVFANMLQNGNLKKIDLVVKTIPPTFDDFIGGNLDYQPEKGKLTTTIQSPLSLSQTWKDFALRQYLKVKNNSTIEFGENAEEYDEIEFSHELNGKTKTFYAKQKSRTLPDLVVDGLQEINGELDIDQALLKCDEIINDVFLPNIDVQ